MKKILILDDDQAVRESLVDFFDDRQWLTSQVENAEDALTMLENNNPDAVVVDVRLPEMNGSDFVRKACKLKSSMAFVFCSGSPEYFVPKDLKEESNVSCKLFVKPIDSLYDLENEVIKIIDFIKKR